MIVVKCKIECEMKWCSNIELLCDCVIFLHQRNLLNVFTLCCIQVRMILLLQKHNIICMLSFSNRLN